MKPPGKLTIKAQYYLDVGGDYWQMIVHKCPRCGYSTLYAPGERLPKRDECKDCYHREKYVEMGAGDA